MISIENLSVEMPGDTFFHDLSFEVESGGYTRIFGESSKSNATLLNIISGLETAYSGDVEIDGVNALETNVLKEHISYLPQCFGLIEDETVEHNLDFVVEGSRRRKRRKVKEVLRQVGLENYSKRKLADLSDFERQKVAFARVFLEDKPVVLVDDPTKKFDPIQAGVFLLMLEDLNKSGKTVLFTTCERVYRGTIKCGLIEF